jgi:hypothetical protein
MPAGLVAILAGMVIAWVASALGFPEIGGMSLAKLGESFAASGSPFRSQRSGMSSLASSFWASSL